MAISPKDRYPGQIDVSDPAGYPRGAAQNIDTPGDGTGTPWEKDLVNDILGFQQALLDAAALAPSGTPDKVGASQYLDAVREVADEQVDARFTVDGEVPLPAPLQHNHYRLGRPTFDGSDWTPQQLVWRSEVNSVGLHDDIGDMLPRGPTQIVAVHVLVKPGIARVAELSRMGVRLTRQNYAGANPVVISDTSHPGSALIRDNGTADEQWIVIDLSGAPVDVSLGHAWYVEVFAGADGGTNKDLYIAVRVIRQSDTLTND